MPTVNPLTGAMCAWCRWLYPLGPANDNDPNVIDEIDAARWDGQWRDAMPMRFHRGYSAHFLGRDISVDERPGWLLREMDTHDSIGIAKRDTDAWPWDPSRPVAGQYEEWRAHMDRGDAMLEEAIASAELANPDIISAISQLGADLTPPELTVEQIIDEYDNLSAHLDAPDDIELPRIGRDTNGDCA